jgi:hypothetical protein
MKRSTFDITIFINVINLRNPISNGDLVKEMDKLMKNGYAKYYFINKSLLRFLRYSFGKKKTVSSNKSIKVN